jgi:2-polyprenyl-6-methoxyphenol hydroxylase-like FAD-dependent oxidoreductase
MHRSRQHLYSMVGAGDGHACERFRKHPTIMCGVTFPAGQVRRAKAVGDKTGAQSERPDRIVHLDLAHRGERVYRLLRGAFPPARYYRGRELAAFEQTSRGVIARFTDGSLAEGDVLIGADGLRSTVRQPCLPAIVPLYAGYVAWRAMLSESVLPHAIHHDLMDAMTFCLPRGEQFLGYPVAGPDNDLRPGRRRYNIIWYRPADEAGELPWLLTDGRGILHSISIPPPLIRGEAIAGMREAAERLVAPQCRALVRLIDEPLLQPIYDLASPRLAFGRVALVGDAAFVARPHVAAGVSKAADDAAALAQALDGDDVESALRRYEQARLPQNNRIIERARHLGAFLQASQSAEERARSAQHSIPEAVLAETALVDFLQELLEDAGSFPAR